MEKIFMISIIVIVMLNCFFTGYMVGSVSEEEQETTTDEEQKNHKKIWLRNMIIVHLFFGFVIFLIDYISSKDINNFTKNNFDGFPTREFKTDKENE